MAKRKYKILIVDDDTAVLEMLELALMSSPYSVRTVDSSVAAYELIEKEHFDIVISDIAMPEMDGLALLKKIKNFNGMIQVIMMTGYITINNTLNAFRYGAVDIFFKPFDDLAAFLKAVDEVAAKLDRVNAILAKVAKQKGA